MIYDWMRVNTDSISKLNSICICIGSQCRYSSSSNITKWDNICRPANLPHFWAMDSDYSIDLNIQ